MNGAPIVVGAGPAGATAALHLAQKGIPCLLLDRAAFPRDKICGDALSGKVVRELERLNPDWVAELGTQPQQQIGSWGVRFVAPSGQDLRVPFRENPPPGMPAPGYLSPRLHWDHWLLQKAISSPGVSFRPEAQVTGLTQVTGGWQLTLTDGQTLTTPLVIGADGAQGITTRALGGIRPEPTHYCAGLRQYYEGVQGFSDDNFIELIFHRRALPGYLWLFPLPDGRANVGIGMRSDIIRRQRIDLKKLLAELLQEPDIAPRFQQARPLEPPRGFGLPLGSKRRRISGDGFLLTGDAASLIDPFTGEGIGNAMISGRLAAHIAAAALQSHDLAARQLAPFDQQVYASLGAELRLSRTLQQLSSYPWLFNWVVAKARRSPTLGSTISAMFTDLDLRARFRSPLFYLKLLTE